MRYRFACALATIVFPVAANAAFIRPEVSAVTTDGSIPVSVRWLIQDTVTPLFGYSLDLERMPVTRGVASGASIDPSMSNFFDERNLLTAGGLERDQDFSIIAGDGSGGVFISTNATTLDGTTPVAGVNDVLAEVVFTIDSSVPGDYVFQLGSGSALSDTSGFPVDFESTPLTITVIPSPAGGLLIISGIGPVALRRRRR